MTDDLTEAFRNLALALEPDLVCRARTGTIAGARCHGWRVENGRGLIVDSETELGAWTAALEACKRRAAWRADKAGKRVERTARRPHWTPGGGDAA